MFGRFVVIVGVILSSSFLMAAQSSANPPAHCIGARCAIIAGGTVFPAVTVVAASALGPGGVKHPATGIYCVEPPGNAAPVTFVPVVTVSDDQSVSPGGGAAAADGLAEINNGAGNCPAPPLGKFPYREIDTFTITAGAVGTVVTASDTVGFDLEF
jgi:hypothetical protein